MDQSNCDNIDEEFILRYIPCGLYTFGLCYYGHHGDPYKTVEVAADSMVDARVRAFQELRPSTIESICYIATRRNEEFFIQQDLWMKARGYT